MKLVVGLGNPGKKYAGTRHNIGFVVVEACAKWSGDAGWRERFNSQCCEVRVGDEVILLACPQTYMNLSGAAIRLMVGFFKLTPADLLVVCDDMNLPVGKLRLRVEGSAGGQKGLQNTIDQLGTTQFSRLRVGVGRPPEFQDPADYVLGKFGADDKEMMESAVGRSVEAVRLWVEKGATAAMNRINAGPENSA
jgi:PTH1 family peptidyl-tRNA hydrolase